MVSWQHSKRKPDEQHHPEHDSGGHRDERNPTAKCENLPFLPHFLQSLCWVWKSKTNFLQYGMKIHWELQPRSALHQVSYTVQISLVHVCTLSWCEPHFPWGERRRCSPVVSFLSPSVHFGRGHIRQCLWWMPTHALLCPGPSFWSFIR